MEQKFLVFRRRNSGRVVKLQSTCPQEFWRNILFFVKKSFVSIIFDYWVSFFDGLVITACYVSKYISGKNDFFEKTFLSISDNEREFFRRSEEIVGRVSRRQSSCPKWWLQAKVCLKKNLIFHHFRTFRKWFPALWKKNWQLSQLQSTCSWEQCDEKFCLKISGFFYRFWTFRGNNPAFCRKFFETAVRIAFKLSKGTFWGNWFSKKICLSFTYNEIKNFGTLSQSLLAWPQKRPSLCPEAQCGEESFFFVLK